MFRIPKTEHTLQLLSDVRRGQWFVHDYESLLPVAVSFLRGEKIADNNNLFEISAAEAQFAKAAFSETSDKAAKVAIVPIIGTITKYDSCFTTGAVTCARAIVEAAEHPDICAIVLDIDSGGGAVSAIASPMPTFAHPWHIGPPRNAMRFSVTTLFLMSGVSAGYASSWMIRASWKKMVIP